MKVLRRFILKSLTILTISFWLAFGLSCVASLTGFWGEHNWILDLTSHFRLQYMAIQLLFAVICLLLRDRTWLVIAVIFLSVNASTMWDYLPFNTLQSPLTPAANQRFKLPLEVLHINLWVKNNAVEKVAALIDQRDPDLLSLQEYNTTWQVDLVKSGVLKRYPFHYVDWDNGIYSKYPLINPHIVFSNYYVDSTIMSQLKLPGYVKPVTVMATHTKTPSRMKYFFRQQRHFEKIQELVNQTPGPVLLIGDYNATPWSAGFRTLVNGTRLIDSERAVGLQPSWPTFIAGIPWIPIDHCLLSPDWRVLHREVGPFIGSDHLPLYLEIALP